MRTIKIESKELTDILTKRAKLFRELGVINEQLVKLDTERTTLGYKMDKLKEKTQVIMDKEKIEVGKYEVITRIYINDNRENEVEILDKIEEYQKMLDEQLVEESKETKE
ncbi:MAG: hypothetical protein HGA35_03635 [Erysipelotrichaceae bacterium]|nr:hypothetical protein [Erysipelotrichaceae bacterium]